MIVVGGGAVGTRAALVVVAERIGAPVLATNAGKGVLHESHPLSLGCTILQQASQTELAESDAVLLVGTELAEGDHFTDKLEITGKLVRIDIDPTELSAMYAADVGIQADAKAALSLLADTLAERPVVGEQSTGETRVESVMDRIAANLTDDERQHVRVWEILRSAMPADPLSWAISLSSFIPAPSPYRWTTRGAGITPALTAPWG